LLIFATCMIYYGEYESIHFMAHLNDDHILLKIPFMKAAKSHHQLHHNTRLMRNWNFNIGLPIMDILFKTYKKAI
jgi:sterol desaturase/sphingolipid hydroxylase (fatty acid hydroxylase superfamily)